MYADDWYVETQPLITKRYESTRDRLFELIIDAAFLPDEFGRAVATEAKLTVDEHVARALERVRAYWDAEWSEARRQLLSIAPIILTATVTGKKNTGLHAEMCSIVRHLRDRASPETSLAARFVACTAFTGSVASDIAAEAIRAVFNEIRPIFKAYAALNVDEIEQQEREIFAPIKVGIYERAADLRHQYEAFKRQHGLLDFTDMQHRALELLDDAGVRDSYARRFKHIVLDEAQDTNDVQMRIIEKLRDGRQSLFAVGDVKQSVYGFRGANVEIFQGLARGGAKDSVSLSLVDNYRSRSEVISFVNEVGSRFWSNGDIEYEPLASKFEYQPSDAGPRVDFWLIDQPDIIDEKGETRLEPVDETREREGVAIAAWIREAVDGSEPLIVYDRTRDSYRPANYGDIAILSNTRNPFPAFERALADLGIPFVKDGGREFFNGREVQDILAALRVLENPLDEVALLTMLRSPLFGWGDRDLARLRATAGGNTLWSAMRHFEPEESTADRTTYRKIEKLRQEANVSPPVRLIELLCDVTAYRAALLCLPRGRAHVANIDKLIDFARTTALLDGSSLTSFLNRATLAEKYLSNETDAPANSVGDDAVVLSTIHGAKGLEWPVVMLSGLDSDYARTEVTSRYYAPEGALILQIKREGDKPLKSAANAALIDAAKARDEAEGRRLFYVGITRARERLILTSTYSYPEPKFEPSRLDKPVKWIAGALGIVAATPEPTVDALGVSEVRVEHFSRERLEGMRDAADRQLDVALDAARRAVRSGEPVAWESPNGAGAEVDAIVSRVTSREAQLATAIRTLALTTVTQLVYFFRCPLVYYFDLVLQVDENPRRRGKGGTVAAKQLSALDRGTRVHDLLERADFDAPAGLEAARLVGQLDDVAPEEIVKIEEMLRSVFADPLVDRLRNAKRVEREYPFFLDLGGTTVHGKIDLVFEDASGNGVVVDYKSNDVSAAGRLDTLTELYRPQIELYALASKRAGLVEPNEGTLYFLNKAQAVSLPVDARRLDLAEARASNALSSIARSAWDTEPGEKCRSCGYRRRGYCEVGKKFRE